MEIKLKLLASRAWGERDGGAKADGQRISLGNDKEILESVAMDAHPVTH